MACGSARIEFGIGAAFFYEVTNWDRVGMDVAFLGANTFAFGVFQEAFITETADVAIKSTNGTGYWPGAGGHARRSAF